jgi:hypothetical protein
MKKHNNRKRGITVKSRSVISKKVVDYESDPFLVEKAQKAKEFLEKHGLPPDFIKK